MQNKIKINDDRQLIPEQTAIKIDPTHEEK